METGFTRDPNAALSGLVGIALLGVLVIGGGLIVTGLLDRSWFRVLSGAVLLVVLCWATWQAGQVVRRRLEKGTGKERSAP